MLKRAELLIQRFRFLTENARPRPLNTNEIVKLFEILIKNYNREFTYVELLTEMTRPPSSADIVQLVQDLGTIREIFNSLDPKVKVFNSRTKENVQLNYLGVSWFLDYLEFPKHAKIVASKAHQNRQSNNKKQQLTKFFEDIIDESFDDRKMDTANKLKGIIDVLANQEKLVLTKKQLITKLKSDHGFKLTTRSMKDLIEKLRKVLSEREYNDKLILETPNRSQIIRLNPHFITSPRKEYGDRLEDGRLHLFYRLMIYEDKVESVLSTSQNRLIERLCIKQSQRGINPQKYMEEFKLKASSFNQLIHQTNSSFSTLTDYATDLIIGKAKDDKVRLKMPCKFYPNSLE